jgi:TetR/AcrR family transcriptional regulator, transcriptional repressor for nem operon
MRYLPQHKAETRDRLLRTGGALAKKSGFAATGVDALTAAADLTAGAFYGHFRSKSDLLAAIVERELSRTLQSFTAKTPEQMAQVLARYLDRKHVDHPAQGCAVPSLGAEIARADRTTRKTFERLMLDIKAQLQLLTGDEAAAWATISPAVGAVPIPRAMASDEARDAVLTATRKAATTSLARATRRRA